MKLEDFAFAIVQYVFTEMERTHHFAVPELVRKAVTEKVKADLDTLVT